METIIAVKGKDFTLVATDSFSFSSIIKTTDTAPKLFPIAEDQLLALSSENPSDRSAFAALVAANIRFATVSRPEAQRPTITEVAKLGRYLLANALRSPSPYKVDAVFAGANQLYYSDYSGGLLSVNYIATGYAGYFLNSLLDDHCTDALTEQEAKNVVATCFSMLKKRFLGSLDKYGFCVVNNQGVGRVELVGV